MTILRAELRQQQEQTEQLQQTIKRLTELMAQQQRLLQALEQKIGRPAPPETAQVDSSERVKAETASRPRTVAVRPPPDLIPLQTRVERLEFSGLMQGWYVAGNRGQADSFRLRRTELKLTGQIKPEISWTAMIDLAKAISLRHSVVNSNGTAVLTGASVNQASRILQDAFITLGYLNRLKVDIGQFKLPLSLEGTQSSSTLDTVERALFLSDRQRGGNYGDVRDIGILVRGAVTSQAEYYLGFFNGSGETQNEQDQDEQKAVAGRFVVRPPFLTGLQTGGSGVWSVGRGPAPLRRQRLGGELQFTRDKYRIKAELMAGVEAKIHRLGYYGLVAYRMKSQLEAVYRFDVWDPDTRLETTAATVTQRDHLLGINYFMANGKVKFQMNYLRRLFANSLLPPRHLVLLNLQTSW